MKALLVAVAMLSGPSSDCGPYEITERFFRDVVGEELVWRGHIEDGVRAELWMSPDVHRTWHFLTVDKDGIACIAYGGDGWGRS